MKKLLMIVLVCVCAFTSVFGEDVQAEENSVTIDNSVETMLVITDLIDDDLSANKSLIMDNAKLLSDVQRNDLFESKKNSAVGPFCLNLFVGFGIGSFVQGDMLAGGIGAGLDVAGITFLGLGINKILKGNYYEDGYFGGAYVVNQLVGENNVKNGIIMVSVGGVVYLGSKIFQSIRPWTYANSFNDELKNALGVYAINFDVMPTFNIASNSPAVTASVSIQL